MTREADGPIALAAGGTGGHLFPAEALAQELKRRGRNTLLVTDARGERYAASFPADDRFIISAASPSVGGPIAKAAAAMSLAGGLLKALGEFRRRRVAAAVGFGGYPSFPAMKAASLLGIPYGVHEQNGVLGRANRLAAPGAAFLAHGFPILERSPVHFRGLLVEVGNPVRDAVMAAARPYVSAGGEISLLIFGGSQGASVFSKVAPAAIAMLPSDIRARLRVTQQAREGEVDDVRRIYQTAGVRAELAPFFGDLPARMAAAHLVIARAGASTVTELSAIGRPSILVPLAIAMDDHQTGNARTLADAGAALIIGEKEFTTDALAARLVEIFSDPARLAAMAERARGRVKSGAAAALADIVESVVAERTRAAA